MFVEKYAQNFTETQRKDTEISPGESDRKGLETMMLELTFETQL